MTTHTDKTIAYLSAIQTLNKDEKTARQKNIVIRLGISPSTCSEAMSKLLRKQFIKEDERRVMHLTNLGKDLLETSQQNQSIFALFFREVLGQCCEDAQSQSEKIEPHINLETNLEMCRFVNFLDYAKGKKIDFWTEWENFSLNPAIDKPCQECAYKKTCLKRRKEI